MSRANFHLSTANAAHLREVEEKDVSALASHAVTASDFRFHDLFCRECDEICTTEGAAREVAKKAYREGWVIHNQQPYCKTHRPHVHDHVKVPKGERTDRMRFVCAMFRCECGNWYWL